MKYEFYDEKHILNIAQKNSEDYYDEFLEVINYMAEILTKEELENLITDKLRFDKIFDFNEYYQYAVETAINYYFARISKDTFKYEVKKDNKNSKDVDCQIRYREYLYNIEVKTPKLTLKNKDLKFIFDRTNILNKKRIEEKMNELKSKAEKVKERLEITLKKINKKSKHHHCWKKSIEEKLRNIENTKLRLPYEIGGANLKDENLYKYLCDLQNKVFEPDKENKVNVLIVALYDKFSFSRWYKYLFGEQGLFTENSFRKSQKSSYMYADIVVFTGIINSQVNFNEKKLNAWKLENNFNIVFKNPFSLKKDSIGVNLFFSEILKENHSYSFYNFLRYKYNIEDYIENIKLLDDEYKKITEELKLPLSLNYYNKRRQSLIVLSNERGNINKCLENINYIKNNELNIFKEFIDIVEQKNEMRYFSNEDKFEYLRQEG